MYGSDANAGPIGGLFRTWFRGSGSGRRCPPAHGVGSGLGRAMQRDWIGRLVITAAALVLVLWAALILWSLMP